MDGKSYFTWVMQMETMLKSYDLAFMVLQDVPILIAFTNDFLDSINADGYKWDWLSAWIHSFIILNCTAFVLAHIQHLTSAR